MISIRKIISAILIIISSICICISSVIIFTSCGMVDDSEFTHCHIETLTTSKCYDITYWSRFFSSGVKIKTNNGEAFCLSEGTFILIKDKNTCPFCNNNNIEEGT